MTPIEFRDGFVLPAVDLWRERPNLPVLAVCAISQLDILAEVVAIAQAGGTLPRTGARDFRNDLAKREPAIERIRSAHDSHKHGRLNRPGAAEITGGQRPYRSAGTASFLGHSFLGASYFGKTSTAILLDDGTPVDVGSLIREAIEAWDRELRRLGYLPPPV